MALRTRKRYRLKEDHRRTVKGSETIILAGTIVSAIQENIHYEKGSHKVQVRTDEGVIAWIKYERLSVLR